MLYFWCVWEGTMLTAVVRYFDLRSPTGTVQPARGPAASTKKRAAAPGGEHAAVLPQYGAVALGVLADPVLRNYIETKSARRLWRRRRDGLRPTDGHCNLAGGLQKRLRSRQADPDPTLRAVRLGTRLAILVPGGGCGDPIDRMQQIRRMRVNLLEGVT
jgi:hypothetical protein